MYVHLLKLSIPSPKSTPPRPKSNTKPKEIPKPSPIVYGDDTKIPWSSYLSLCLAMTESCAKSANFHLKGRYKAILTHSGCMQVNSK